MKAIKRPSAFRPGYVYVVFDDDGMHFASRYSARRFYYAVTHRTERYDATGTHRTYFEKKISLHETQSAAERAAAKAIRENQYTKCAVLHVENE